MERMTALRILEDHDRLLHSADGRSGMAGVAVRNRWVLATTCVLVALGLLLCAERPSLAKQPAKVPDPAGPATPQRSISQGPQSVPNAGGRAPVARSRRAALRAERLVRGEPANVGPASRPARGEGVHRGPVSRPVHRPSTEHGAPAGRRKPAEPPGRQTSSLHKPAHVPREHPQGRPRGPQKPVGQDPVRPHPEKPVDRGPVSHPNQQPTPKPKPVHEPHDNPLGKPQGEPQGGEDTGRPEGTGPHGQQAESGPLPDKENTHTPVNGLAEAPGRPEGHSGQGTATDQEPHNDGGHLPAAVGKDSEGGDTGYEDKTANAPAGGPPSGTGMVQHPDRRAASTALPGHEPGSGTRSTEGRSRRSAKAAADTLAPHPTAVRRKDAARTAGDSALPDQQVAGHSRAVEAASPAARGERPPAGYGVLAASETPFGSTEYFFGYLWDGNSFSVQQDQDGIGPMRDGARGFVPATSHGGVLTQRAPPLPIPSPFSGIGLTMGGAVFSASSSGDGDAPLFAVIFICLSAVLWRGRSRAYGALLRAGTVPRLALERPG